MSCIGRKSAARDRQDVIGKNPAALSRIGMVANEVRIVDRRLVVRFDRAAVIRRGRVRLEMAIRNLRRDIGVNAAARGGGV